MKKNTFLLISLGAIPGSLVRWQIDEMFLVNLIGCFLLGFFNSFAISNRYKLTLGVGLCGSMTTFCGWSSHLHNFLSQGLYKSFLFNLISIALIGLFSMGLGHVLGKQINA